MINDQIKNQKIILRKTSELIPYARNARKHEEWQILQIAASINEFGFTNPILIDSQNEIIAGHGRVMAALKLDINEVPCLVLDHLTEIQKKAYAIADNKIALNSGWNEDLLRLELQELNIDQFDFSKLGFNDLELSKFLTEGQELIENKDDEWEGMPEFDQKDKTSFRHIIVHFENNDDVSEFFSLIGQSHTDKTKSIWFPEQIRMDTESKRYD